MKTQLSEHEIKSIEYNIEYKIKKLIKQKELECKHGK